MKNKQTRLITTIAIVLIVTLYSLPPYAHAVSGVGTSTTTKTSVIRDSNFKNKLQDAKKKAQELRDGKLARASTTNSTLTASSTKVAKTVGEAIKKADKDIADRIASLNKVLDKVQGMKNISATDIDSLKSEIQSEVSKLTTLNAKVDADTDLPTIKTDLQSIISGSRIYVLEIPKINILASVDKINTVSTMLQTISTKLQSRIDEAKAAGTDVSALQIALDNINSKLTDAAHQAVTAQATVSALAPDNGNKTILDSNNVSLKSAKANIKTANQDLNAARKSASTIADGLKLPGGKTAKINKNDLSQKTGRGVDGNVKK